MTRSAAFDAACPRTLSPTPRRPDPAITDNRLLGLTDPQENTSQFARGFVRTRLMARNVELLQACVAQEGQRTYPTPEEAPGILLVDFRKAYDTLNRPYLLRAMEALSFAPAFIQLVDRMHQNTTARFLVNGSTSRPIPVTRGIRQGCPLAPLLFPIAAEGLRHMVADHRTIRGITLHAGSHSSEHRIATFLDDTAIMVQKAACSTQSPTSSGSSERTAEWRPSPQRSSSVSATSPTAGKDFQYSDTPTQCDTWASKSVTRHHAA